MKKSELKNGAVVELRNGFRFLKVDNTLLNLTMNGDYMTLDEYNEYLENTDDEWSIVKVNNNCISKNGYCNNALKENYSVNKWTWSSRKEY